MLMILLIIISTGCNRFKKPTTSVDAKEEIPDVTLVSEISSETSIQRVSFKLKGGRARTDTEEGLFSTIHDPDVGTTILDHTKKAFQTIQIDLPDNSQISEEIAAKICSAFEMRYTGKVKKIGKWECEEFVLFDSFDKGFPEGLQSRSIGWIAKNFEGGAAIQARKEKVAPSQLVKWMAKTSGKDVFFPGFAVRTVTEQRGHYPTISTCVDISYASIDAGILEIPASYTDLSPKKNPNKAEMTTPRKPSD